MKTVEQFEELRALEGRRVKMRFEDGHEVIARLVSVTVDIDGSRHRIYDNAYQASDNTGFYNEGETLVAIDWMREEPHA